MQIGDNYLNDGHNYGHLLPEIPRVDGQSATECCPLHTNNTSFNSVSQWSSLKPGRHRLLPDAAACRTTTHISDHHSGRRRGWSRAGRRCGWTSAPAAYLTFHVVARWLLFVTKLISAIRWRRFADVPVFQHAPMLPIFDVRCVHRMSVCMSAYIHKVPL